MVKSVTILGSTGSIGKSTLKLIRQHSERFVVSAICASNNAETLAEQANEFKPKLVAIADERKLEALRNLINYKCEIVAGSEAAVAAAEFESDIVIAGIVGFAGLKPTMAAAKRGVTLGLANKEAMVCAGPLINAAAEKAGTKIIPIDSEHNAAYQVFDFKNIDAIEKIILTASGGPLRNLSAKELENVTPEQAVNHPNWKMGAKISVDSATLMNKGLEVIEAYYLFPLKHSQIDVVVHPESVIHSLVMYNDGAVLAQASNPDMCVPISYVLGYPDRLANNSRKLDLTEYGRLNFEKPDYEKFPCLKYARQAMEAGLSHQIVLNAANEIAVAKFLNREIKFTDIAKVVENALSAHSQIAINSVDDVNALDQKNRESAISYCKAV